MSYEGRIQYLCKKGHYYVVDAGIFLDSDEEIDKTTTCDCGEKPIWENSVDDTNGDAVGFIDIRVFQIEEPRMCTCAGCGHTHAVEEARYRIPTEAETRDAQTYWDGKMTRTLNDTPKKRKKRK